MTKPLTNEECKMVSALDDLITVLTTDSGCLDRTKRIISHMKLAREAMDAWDKADWARVIGVAMKKAKEDANVAA